jgi:hypothetical protein
MPRDGDGDYEVGYGKPPLHCRFVKGQSGNPRGRPPGAKNVTTLLNEALDELVPVTDHGGRRNLSKRRAIIIQLVNQAAKADLRAIKILLDFMRDIERQTEPMPSETPEFSEADEKVLEQLRARFSGGET